MQFFYDNNTTEELIGGEDDRKSPDDITTDFGELKVNEQEDLASQYSKIIEHLKELEKSHVEQFSQAVNALAITPDEKASLLTTSMMHLMQINFYRQEAFETSLKKTTEYEKKILDEYTVVKLKLERLEGYAEMLEAQIKVLTKRLDEVKVSIHPRKRRSPKQVTFETISLDADTGSVSSGYNLKDSSDEEN